MLTEIKRLMVPFPLLIIKSKTTFDKTSLGILEYLAVKFEKFNILKKYVSKNSSSEAFEGEMWEIK